MGVRHSKKVIDSARWKSLRVVALRRDNYRCVQCNAAGRMEVDHIQPVRTHPEMAYELENLQCLCKTCHSLKTRVERGESEVSNDRRLWRSLVSNHETPPITS